MSPNETVLPYIVFVMYFVTVTRKVLIQDSGGIRVPTGHMSFLFLPHNTLYFLLFPVAEGAYLSHSPRLQSITAGKGRHQELEAAGHITPSQEQRTMN